MDEPFVDRNPYHYIPPEFRPRAEAWIAASHNLMSASDSLISLAIENLMFAERPILQMEQELAQGARGEPHDREPLLLTECSTLSILWVFGLYEITRILSHRKHSLWSGLAGIHKKLEVLRMPLAKHEVRRQRGLVHYPTSLWAPETGRVGWLVYNPDVAASESYFRTELADEFLTAAAGKTQF